MYDFQGMNSRLASFRQLEPSEGHQVRNLSWSPTADRFLCVTGSAQAKVLDTIFFLLSLLKAVVYGGQSSCWCSLSLRFMTGMDLL